MFATFVLMSCYIRTRSGHVRGIRQCSWKVPQIQLHVKYRVIRIGVMMSFGVPIILTDVAIHSQKYLISLGSYVYHAEFPSLAKIEISRRQSPQILTFWVQGTFSTQNTFLTHSCCSEIGVQEA